MLISLVDLSLSLLILHSGQHLRYLEVKSIVIVESYISKKFSYFIFEINENIIAVTKPTYTSLKDSSGFNSIC